MGRVQEEAIRLIGVGFTDILIRSQTVKGFETLDIVVGIDESGEMALKLLGLLVMRAFNGSLFNGTVHAFDLAVDPNQGYGGCEV
jgi:hypothetical protein